MNELYLVDTSVWTRRRKPPVAERLISLLDAGRVATCAILDLEHMRQVQSAAAIEALVDTRASLHWLATPDEVWDRILEVQGELSSTGRRTAVKIPDLILAAVAERHRAAVLHYDKDFDTIAEITGQPAEWVVPAGAAD